MEKADHYGVIRKLQSTIPNKEKRLSAYTDAKSVLVMTEVLKKALARTLGAFSSENVALRSLVRRWLLVALIFSTTKKRATG